MHELSVALSIVDVVAEELERHGNARVEAVHLRLGPLAGVVKEALLSAYELAREGTPLHDSRLEVEETPLVVYCSTCAAERGVVSIQQLCCERCGDPATEIVRGRELEVIALELTS